VAVSPRNKINGFADTQSYQTRGRGEFVAPEAQTVWILAERLYQRVELAGDSGTAA